MIDRERAADIARDQIRHWVASGDPLFAAFPRGQTEVPVAVHTIWGEFSYWLVPYREGRYVVGFVRIAADGGVIAAGLFSPNPRHLQRCPQVVTGITPEEALNLVRAQTHPPDEEIGTPLFIHDGPIGREVWFVPVTIGGKVRRWIFANRGGTYERPAGSLLDEELE